MLRLALLMDREMASSERRVLPQLRGLTQEGVEMWADEVQLSQGVNLMTQAAAAVNAVDADVVVIAAAAAAATEPAKDAQQQIVRHVREAGDRYIPLRAV